jgi:hypothetical protein
VLAKLSESWLTVRMTALFCYTIDRQTVHSTHSNSSTSIVLCKGELRQCFLFRGYIPLCAIKRRKFTAPKEVLGHRDKHIMSLFLKRGLSRMEWEVNKRVTGWWLTYCDGHARDCSMLDEWQVLYDGSNLAVLCGYIP